MLQQKMATDGGIRTKEVTENDTETVDTGGAVVGLSV